MNENMIISKINEALHQSTIVLADWLKKMLYRISDNWWQECVMDKLSYNQHNLAVERNITKLEQFDLAALLRIADRNWYAMRDFAYLPTKERECIREMLIVRNNWAHCSGILPSKENTLYDISVIIEFLEQRCCDLIFIDELYKLKDAIECDIDSAAFSDSIDIISIEDSTIINNSIEEKSMVYLIGQPDKKGMVFSVETIGNTKKYEVFVDGTLKTFYDGQVALVDNSHKYNWIDLSTLQSYLSAFEINNPSSGSLYSLNSARIDFVPYQFRPALKLIKSDEPRILIADSVGVGKTIEAGLIIKELEARHELEKVMIICPKPLVSERKWETEMKRFDEEFEPLTGNMLRQIINDADRDGEWPGRYNKTIVPYSILDSRVLNGDDEGKIDSIGLLGLDPEPHFDLVIVDEAHHIRNGRSVFAASKEAVKYMAKQGGGSIINISSVGGLVPDISQVAYGTSKAAINYLTKLIAVHEAKNNIRCNAVLPGMTATDAVEKNLTGEFRELFLRHIPFGRMGKPEEIAAAAVYFASDESAYTTGQILTVSGGFGLATPLYGDLSDMLNSR